MAIEYTVPTETVKAGATQYNVQPNLSLSRAFEATERAILGGMKLQEQIKEEDFRKRQSDLNNTISAFNEDYAKANWAQKQVMAGELESLVVTPYGEDNRWDRALASAGKEFKSRVIANLEAEREQRARAAAAAARAAANAAKTNELNLAYLRLQQDLQDVTDPAEQSVLLGQWKTDNVDKFEGVDPAAYNKALGYYVNVRGHIVENRNRVADSQIKDNILVGLQAEISANGGLTPDVLKGMYAQAEQLSDYSVNKSAINNSIAEVATQLIYNHYNEPTRVNTQADVDTLNAQISDLVEADPRIMGSSGYRLLQNSAAQLQATVDTREKTNIAAMLQDGGVSQAVFDKRIDEAAGRGLFTPEQVSQLKYDKRDNTEKLAQRETIAPLVMAGDAATLAAKVQDGSLNGTTVSSTIGDILAARHAQLTQDMPNETANVNSYILEEFKKYQQAGVAPTKLPMIDQALSVTKSGELLSNDQITTFLATYEAAKAAGYHGVADSRITADYLAIRGMANIGVPNIGEKLYNAKSTPIRVSDKDIDKALNNGIQDGTGLFTEGLNPTNAQLLRSYMRPVTKMMMQAGVDPEDVTDFVSQGMESMMMRVDPAFGGGNTVWIPRTEDIPTPDHYNRVYDALNTEMKSAGSKLAYVGPYNMSDIEGNWLAIDVDGNQLTIPYADITVAARTGRLP